MAGAFWCEGSGSSAEEFPNLCDYVTMWLEAGPFEVAPGRVGVTL